MNQQAKGQEASVPEAAFQKEPPVSTRHPAGFYFFFWGEFAERCSYYGMRAILVLYLISVLNFTDASAANVSFSFKAACYFLPLLGGFLADRYFGKYWTIVGFSIPYVLGHFILGIETVPTLILALLLLACGSGVIKPNISTLMGMTYDEKRPGQPALRSSAFLWFYFSINVGAFLSQLTLPWVRTYLVDRYADPGFAYRVTFQLPAWLMVAALAIFAAGKRHYAREKLDRAREVTPEERRQRWSTLTALFGIFALMVLFWIPYEQNDNLWILFARDHIAGDKGICELNLGFTRLTFSPDGFQFINPMSILILVPLFGWMWKKVDPQATRFKPATKIFMGFLCTAVTVGAISLAAYLGSGGEKVSAWWVVLSYVFLTVAEILVYGTGLELAYTAAPANMKGFITACFLVTIGLGDLLNIPLSPLYKTSIVEWKFFAIMAGMVLVGSLAFYFVGRRFNRRPASPTPDPAAT